MRRKGDGEKPSRREDPRALRSGGQKWSKRADVPPVAMSWGIGREFTRPRLNVVLSGSEKRPPHE